MACDRLRELEHQYAMEKAATERQFEIQRQVCGWSWALAAVIGRIPLRLTVHVSTIELLGKYSSLFAVKERVHEKNM